MTRAVLLDMSAREQWVAPGSEHPLDGDDEDTDTGADTTALDGDNDDIASEGLEKRCFFLKSNLTCPSNVLNRCNTEQVWHN